MRKKITAFLVCGILAISLAGCSQVKNIDAPALAQALLENGVYSENLTEVSSKITAKRYNLAEGDAEEIYAYAGTNAVVDEIAIFKTADADAVFEKAAEHIASQTKTYESYRPSEVSKLENSVVTTVGDYVIVCVSEDSAKAKEIIEEYTE